MTIKEPFGTWAHGIGPDVIRRDSGDYAFWVLLNTNRVGSNFAVPDSAYYLKEHHVSLADAVGYVDEYIATRFEVEKTTEQKLSNALAEIELLKQELRIAVRRDSHESAKPLQVGQKVKSLLYGDTYTTVNRVTSFAGVVHYECDVDGKPGLYLRSELEPA